MRYAPTDLATFVLVEPGDRLTDIEAAIGIPIATNLIDGCRWPDPDYVPSTEWIADHGGLYELVYVLSDDGAGIALFVPDAEGVDPDLLAICHVFGERDQ